ncbi:carbohydrate-binding module family 1 protein [Hymenopellis radicata]|nr:carbohydrate-binding module family 1 protein [Hymenopellis radicata]
MGRATLLSLSLFALISGVLSQTAPAYGQCGGTGWTGATTCVSGYTCTYSNAWYSQCLPGTGTAAPLSSTAQQSGTATTTASGGSTTLQPGYSFIRAVEDPNFHKYLRSEVKFTASQAVLGEPGDAAQFQITGGQLIQNANGTPLYAVVETPADSTVKKLAVSWSASPSTSGAFVFSGDTVEWSSPNMTRPQNNAWLVCPDAAGLDLYINLGAYAYQTPAGCADETIHAYTGSTATA